MRCSATLGHQNTEFTVNIYPFNDEHRLNDWRVTAVRLRPSGGHEPDSFTTLSLPRSAT